MVNAQISYYVDLVESDGLDTRNNAVKEKSYVLFKWIKAEDPNFSETTPIATFNDVEEAQKFGRYLTAMQIPK